MANNVSGFGLQLILVASNTFPAGIVLTQFSDDSDPLDVPAIKVAEVTTGVNGDLIVASKANPIITKIGLIPDSDDDVNMAILLEANRAGAGKIVARDVITLTAMYPSGKQKIIINGAITDGSPATGIGSSGKMKSKEYSFAFENRIGN